MRLLLFVALLSSTLFGSYLSTIYNYYEKQEYEKGCDYGTKYYTVNSSDEKFLTFYALSCLETNHIDRIARPMAQLTQSKSSRENASYFSTILLQKQLLMQAILDDRPLGELKLPQTNFYLSKIFDLFVAGTYTKDKDVYRLTDSEKEDKYYELYIETTKKNEQYMIIDIYEENRFTKRYQYK